MSDVRGFAVVIFSCFFATTAFGQWQSSGGVTSTADEVQIGPWTNKPDPIAGVKASVDGDLFAGLISTPTNPSPGRMRIASNPNEGYLQWNVYYAGLAGLLRLFDTSKPGWDIALSGSADRLSVRRYPPGSGAVEPAVLVTFSPTGAVFSGTVRGANIEAHYQDVAEWVPATDDLAPGTVVVLNATKNNEVMASARAYDTAVAGVVSPSPGLILGERGDAKEMIATTGRVKVKVDARARPVKIGDLLTTSDLSGAAMASEPILIGNVKIHRPGTILGKALEPLEGGVGEVLVLLTLQ